MKRTLSIILALSIAGIFLITPVTAATSQGLEWGISVGDQFNFQMSISEIDSEDEDVNEGIYMEVESRDTIPNVLTDWADMPDIDIDLAWTNGTSMGFSALIFLFIGATGGKIAVPIGNFTLLTELLLDTYENLTVSENSAYWEVVAEYEYLNQTGTVTTSYLKEDGFLAKYIVSIANQTHTVADLSVIRDGLPSEIMVLLQDNILIIGGGIAVIVILGLVVCKKK